MYSLTIHNMDALDALALPKKGKIDFGEFAGKWSEREAAAFNARVVRSIDAEDWR